MKTTRRGFFATLMAPLLGRLMSKLPVVLKFRQPGMTTTTASLNGLQECIDDGICPSWDGNVYATYGSVARNELERRLTQTCRQLQALELHKSGLLERESLLKELEIRMTNAEQAMHEKLLKDPDLEA